jgi:excisionase family DNA binding protein
MRLFSVREAAERLSVPPSTVYGLCEAGELTHRRVGRGRGCIRFLEEDLQEYLERRKVGRMGEPPAPKAKACRA